jgi:Uma2 family endonuclease
MATATLISVDEYLSHNYEPDCDFIDGVIEERNVGQKDHSKVQLRIAAWFLNRSQQLGMASFVEMRLRVAPNRYRIPDVLVVELPEPEEQVFTEAPYLCIEVLSPDDSFSSVQRRVQDYITMGVRNVWILDPQQKLAWYFIGSTMTPAGEVLTSLDSKVSVELSEIF